LENSHNQNLDNYHQKSTLKNYESPTKPLPPHLAIRRLILEQQIRNSALFSVPLVSAGASHPDGRTNHIQLVGEGLSNSLKMNRGPAMNKFKNIPSQRASHNESNKSKTERLYEPIVVPSQRDLIIDGSYDMEREDYPINVDPPFGRGPNKKSQRIFSDNSFSPFHLASNKKLPMTFNQAESIAHPLL